eukprot:2791222-Amphidinium_carterae.4
MKWSGLVLFEGVGSEACTSWQDPTPETEKVLAMLQQLHHVHDPLLNVEYHGLTYHVLLVLADHDECWTWQPRWEEWMSKRAEQWQEHLVDILQRLRDEWCSTTCPGRVLPGASTKIVQYVHADDTVLPKTSWTLVLMEEPGSWSLLHQSCDWSFIRDPLSCSCKMS